jgi:predicted nucleic acid-binding protein
MRTTVSLDDDIARRATNARRPQHRSERKRSTSWRARGSPSRRSERGTWAGIRGHLFELLGKYQIRGNLVSGAQLAALAIEHGLTVYSADTDFARFTELTWVNPVSPD